MKRDQLSRRNMALASAFGTVLFGLPLLSTGMSSAQGAESPSQQAQAIPAYPDLNPCPSIYYEEPFNSTRIVPQGCPANDATLIEQGAQQGQEAQPIESTSPMTSPAPQPINTSTQAAPDRNPCPSIYYEEPFNSTRRVPQGCPANDATLEEQGQQGM